MMTFQQYLNYFNQLLTIEKRPAPYDNDAYFQYTKMNGSRTNRWLKQAALTEITKKVMAGISQPQLWVVITEPWCGDAAHSVPVLYLMSQLNDHIDFKLQLRDHDSEIEKYLTNGTRSIPVLIVGDANGNDLFRWGPRPAVAKTVFDALRARNADFEEVKTSLQQVYNADKGASVQQEVTTLLTALG